MSPTRGRLRIISGGLRGRRIRVPPGERVRPTTDRVREALFSILGDRLPGARVLDLFSGSGALGLEALSRGASRVAFVESDRGVARVLRANVESLGVSQRCDIVVADVFRTLEQASLRDGPYDIIFADPPYRSGSAERILHGVATTGLLPRAGILVLEASTAERDVEIPRSGLILRRAERYGDTRLEFFESSRTLSE